MSEWIEHRLGEVCSRLSSGSNITAKDIHESGRFPVFGGNGIRGYTAEANFSGECAIIGRQGAYCGNVRYFIGQARMSEHAIVACAGPSHNTRFLAYLLSNMNLGSLSGQAAQPGLSVKVLAQQSVQMPSRQTQERIAEILGAYDDLIEVNRRRVAVLEEMARGLFEEWFVRFRFPGHETVPIVDTSEGPLPEGWRSTVVSDAFSLLRGRSYRSTDLADAGGMPFVNLKCILRDGGFKPSGLKRYTGDFKPNHIVRRGDIVMAVTDMTQERRIVGRVGRIPLLDEPEAVISMDLVKVQPAEGIDLVFLYSWLRNSDFGLKAAQHANGANVLHLSPKAVADLPILLPDNATQAAFGSAATPLFQLAEVLSVTEQRLTATRDLLLPRLISGQLSVEAAERELEEAA